MKFEDRLDAADEGRFWPIAKWFIGLLFVIFVVGIGIRIVCAPVNYAARAAAVVSHELDPAVLLQKYQWFKDAHAALDAKLANIKVYERRRQNLEKTYGAASRWPRDVREEWSLEESELSGIVASYNMLAADYNAQMAKINWRFTNVGDLPAGATEPLPRAYAPYQEAP